jgi:hypothetical protein
MTIKGSVNSAGHKNIIKMRKSSFAGLSICKQYFYWRLRTTAAASENFIPHNPGRIIENEKHIG